MLLCYFLISGMLKVFEEDVLPNIERTYYVVGFVVGADYDDIKWSENVLSGDTIFISNRNFVLFLYKNGKYYIQEGCLYKYLSGSPGFRRETAYSYEIISETEFAYCDEMFRSFISNERNSQMFQTEYHPDQDSDGEFIFENKKTYYDSAIYTSCEINKDLFAVYFRDEQFNERELCKLYVEHENY